MMIAYLIILAAFWWLGIETHWLSIRLAMPTHYKPNLGACPTPTHSLPLPELVSEPKTEPTSVSNSLKMLEPVLVPLQLAQVTPVAKNWQMKHYGHKSAVLCLNCRHKSSGCGKLKGDNWMGWALPARTLKVAGSTLNLAEGCHILRAGLLKDIVRADKGYKVAGLTDSRRDAHIITDKLDSAMKRLNTPYIVSQAWLDKAQRKAYPEAAIEITVGAKSISLNGDYKTGKIKAFMADYTTRTRIGKKSVNLNVGIADKVS